ncbi:MAG: N-acetylneuraminate synthase family protein [Candidatus Omnitrophota bacterium]
MKAVKIGDRMVGEGYPVYIIAEIGSNFDGDLDKAKHLVDLAIECGCDAVKFQSFCTNKIICREAFDRIQEESKIVSFQSKWNKSVFEIYNDAQFKREWHKEIFSYCRGKNISFFSSAYDEEAIDLLEELGVAAHKVGSGEISWPDRLKRFGETGTPVILGTGAATLAEIDEAVRAIRSTGNEDIILLQCVTNYPSLFEDANIRVIDTLRTAFNVQVGYSDHTPGSVVPLGAVARGACMIEKHFTDDKRKTGPDHPHAMDVDDMKEMVRDIRNMEKALGSSVKGVVPSERETVILQRRSLFAARDIKKGDVLDARAIAVLRPQTGILPKDLDIVLGRTAGCDIKKGESILWDKIA